MPQVQSAVQHKTGRFTEMMSLGKHPKDKGARNTRTEFSDCVLVKMNNKISICYCASHLPKPFKNTPHPQKNLWQIFKDNKIGIDSKLNSESLKTFFPIT